MELYQLNSFVTVARLGNMTRAAENLYISLSALSSQIKMLEEELEVRLFDRKPRGMELTVAGRVLFEHAVVAVDSADEVRRQALSMKGEILGNLTFGLNTDPVFLRVAQLNHEIERVLHKTTVFYEISQTSKTPDMLRRGEIDLGFVYGTLDEEDVTSIPVYTANVQVIVPKALIADLNGVTWAELADIPWLWGSNECPFNSELMRRVDRYIPPRKKIIVTDELVVKELVRSGQAACMLREEDTKDLIESGLVNHWNNSNFEMPVSIAFLKSRENEELIRAALSVVRGLFVDKCVSV